MFQSCLPPIVFHIFFNCFDVFLLLLWLALLSSSCTAFISLTQIYLLFASASALSYLFLICDSYFFEPKKDMVFNICPLSFVLFAMNHFLWPFEPKLFIQSALLARTPLPASQSCTARVPVLSLLQAALCTWFFGEQTYTCTSCASHFGAFILKHFRKIISSEHFHVVTYLKSVTADPFCSQAKPPYLPFRYYCLFCFPHFVHTYLLLSCVLAATCSHLAACFTLNMLFSCFPYSRLCRSLNPPPS